VKKATSEDPRKAAAEEVNEEAPEKSKKAAAEEVNKEALEEPKTEGAESEGEGLSKRRRQSKQGKKRSGAPRPKVKKAPAVSVYECRHEGCNYKCSRKDLLDRHEATHLAKLFECTMCAWKFKSQGRLDKHIINRHSDTSTYGQGRQARREAFSDAPRECVPLGEDAGVEDQRVEDGTERSAGRGVKRTAVLREAKPHVCSTCGRVCKTAGDLAAHVKIHEPIEQRTHFRCTWPGCPRTYLSEFARRQHIRSVHLKEKRFTCDLCSRSFAHKHNLAAHKCSAEAAPEAGPPRKQRRIAQPLGDASLKRFADKFFVSDELPMAQNLLREDAGCDGALKADGRGDGRAARDGRTDCLIEGHQLEGDQHVD
jgi:hypothetical protein